MPVPPMWWASWISASASPTTAAALPGTSRRRSRLSARGEGYARGDRRRHGERPATAPVEPGCSRGRVERGTVRDGERRGIERRRVVTRGGADHHDIRERAARLHQLESALAHGRRHSLGSDDEDACAGVVRKDVIRGSAAGRDERVIPHRQADLSKVLGVDLWRALGGVGADDHFVSGIVELVQDLAGAGE